MNKILSLNGEWELSNITEGKSYGSAAVPGTVLGTLLEKGVIPDPYYRLNEYGAREVMTNDFLYERRFYVNDEDRALADHVFLRCEGLDTITRIEVNGQVVAETRDFHRTYLIPIKSVLRSGENTIQVFFLSSLNFVREEDRTNDIHYASTGCIHGNAALRKPHYMFGWDWGPQLPDAGIFRSIKLVFISEPTLQDLRIVQHHKNGTVRLCIQSEIGYPTASITTTNRDKALTLGMSQRICALPTAETCEYQLRIEITGPDGYMQETSLHYANEVFIDIDDPQLWWPNGVGPQNLYTVRITLVKAGACIETVTKRIGLRTITVCTDKHSWGEEFSFVVNSIKIFAMGANVIPEDSLLTRITGNRTRKMIKDCKAANFNCLRVWGGGYYPSDEFYDACDEAGIMIWQDLMFACDVYRLTEDFEQNIIEETVDNVQRIRHHACLALWCGNNEMEWGWGDMWARIRGHHPRYKADYTKIFEYILPKTVKAYDEATYWWPSSPSSGGSYDEPNAVNRGDQHYWEVWHSGKPFTEYRKNNFTFCSEYGFQSFPGIKTIDSFTFPEDRNIFSEVMESHQKNPQANGKILNYVADYFLYPKDLASLAYISQVLQLKAIQYGVEHWRRNRGRCMGSLYWQLNDCWPVASWASVDYYGRWKALHYGARRFYQPIMVSACEEEELSTHITYYGHNDTLSDFRGSIEVELLTEDFNSFWRKSFAIDIKHMSAEALLDVDFAGHIPAECEKKRLFARVQLRNSDGGILSEQTTLFVKPKHFAYAQAEYRTTVSESETNILIHVSSNHFAQYVELDLTNSDVIFSDNYFDISSPDGKMVRISKTEYPLLSADDIRCQLTVRSIADTF